MSTITEITHRFVKFNRALVTANEPAEWTPAATAIEGLLSEIEGLLPALTANREASPQAKMLSILLTVMAEAGQYRHEQFNGASDAKRRQLLEAEFLPVMEKLRRHAIAVAKQYFSSAIFKSLTTDLQEEVFPLLDSMLAPERFMPFRVIQVGNISERLFSFRLRTHDSFLLGDEKQVGLLDEIYNHKYLRFGTSGVRGRWQVDLNERRAQQVAQAICDFLKADNVPAYVGAEDLSGKKMVLGYDSRKNAQLLAEKIAQVCLANGFTVDFANRDTPTPALVYYLTDYLAPDATAGLINCTASHNPPEWQGIKFNPRLGYPAPTNVTDFIAFRINEMQLLDQSARVADLSQARERGVLTGFDPIADYTRWILANGQGNARLPLDLEGIRKFFADKLVVVDEMHGAGRGYLTKILGEIGVRHTVLHAERDADIPGLDYANPEEPYNNDLKKAVAETGAWLGLGLDTDADRFGIVDKGGQYIRPNQILPMLVRYLGVDRKYTGRVIATQTGSPLIEVLAGNIPQNDAHKPKAGTIPAYVNHPFYKLYRGAKADRSQAHTFLVPVGIKYIEEVRRIDSEYRAIKNLPTNWRDTLLIGGEESSGLTTRGHVTDKDGVWANLLVLDMLAYYAQNTPASTIAEIWQATLAQPGCWASYGGREGEGSNSGRVDIDAVLEAKEAFIDYFLNYTAPTFADLEIVFLGGTRYDLAELQLRDATGNTKHYLRVRASGTEPINRVYVESSDKALAEKIMRATLQVLEEISAQQIQAAGSAWRMVDILSQTRPSNRLVQAAQARMAQDQWSTAAIVEKLQASAATLELRTKKIAGQWSQLLQK